MKKFVLVIAIIRLLIALPFMVFGGICFEIARWIMTKDDWEGMSEEIVKWLYDIHIDRDKK